ncbi:SGNH/GDSL hydrolase family protein [Jiulongibacter sediminis]|jgi:lysophospholipase L1-like esterase|uniref:SGNH/GDSL hydrolase family protein n=1 Tax=Jiulongibacter sediminis TaxID=1605367 RepID=UPI0026F2660B|nr:SGNH/GDSL hydrolase family protein [Jiulongibacter sediminis]
MNRRTFLAANTGLLVSPKIQKEWPKRFLFIGDSITDGNRGRNEDPNHILGHGYVFSIASRLGAKYPEKSLSFVNRGISGNTVIDLQNRWVEDCLKHQPEVLTIMVGINDFYFQVKEGRADCTPQNYDKVYRELLTETKSKLLGVELVIMSPFLLPIGKAHGLLYESHGELFEQYHEASKKVALDFGATFIDLQEMYLKEARNPDYEYWIWDGIHPTYSGHELLTQAWFEATGYY